MANEKEYIPTSQIAKTALRTKSGDVTLLAVEHTVQPYYSSDYLASGRSLEVSNLDRFIIKANKKPSSGQTISVRANLPAEQVAGLWALSDQVYRDMRLAAYSSNPVTQSALERTIESSIKESGLFTHIDRALDGARKSGVDTTAISEVKKNCLALPSKISAPLVKEYFEKYTKPVILYSSPAKYFSNKNDNDENECYELSVSFTATNRMPIQIVIKNYWAPINRKPDNTTQIMLSKAHDAKTVMTWMSLDEWFCTISNIKAFWDEYTTASFTPRYRKSLVGRNPK